MSHVPAPRVPIRREETNLVRVQRGAVLRVTGAPDVVLNPTALALWELCDGTTAVDEMVAAVVELFAVSDDVAREDVERALADMEQAGLIR